MAAQVIKGKIVAEKMKASLESDVKEVTLKTGRAPGLAVVLVGNNAASQTYVNSKRRVSKELGIADFSHDLEATVSEKELLDLIEHLNQDNRVDGILVQLPLPNHISETKVLHAIDPAKDVDGFHPYNVGLLSTGSPVLVACTAAGVMELIKSTGVELKGKKAVVVGRSNIVGKPVSMLLLNEHATVTMCHSRTANLSEECLAADILVVAVGKKYCILGDWVKPGAIVIDVGMNRDESGLCGDVAFEQACQKAAYITPVPGGVGPMTIIMLMANTIKAAKQREGLA